jgi:hypothetical protein
VALACVALRGASATWVAALLGLVLVALTAAVPLAVFRTGTQRAFLLGFALFGWMYVLVLAYGWSLDRSSTSNAPLAPRSLVTSRLALTAFERLYGPVQVTYSFDGEGGLHKVYSGVAASDSVTAEPIGVNLAAPLSSRGKGPQRAITVPDRDHFINVAHAFWTLLLATLGGWFTRVVYATRPQRHDPCSPTPNQTQPPHL